MGATFHLVGILCIKKTNEKRRLLKRNLISIRDIPRNVVFFSTSYKNKKKVKLFLCGNGRVTIAFSPVKKTKQDDSLRFLVHRRFVPASPDLLFFIYFLFCFFLFPRSVWTGAKLLRFGNDFLFVHVTLRIIKH